MRIAVFIAATLLVLCVVLFPVHGQELDAASSTRLARSIVKVAATHTDGTGVSGSGTIIDARGYVLTNFHVVGHLTPGKGVPGSLINARNLYPIATREGADAAARFRYFGSVVRGDVRLDLALLRIVRDIGGSAVRRDFPAVQIGSTRALAQQGAPVWILGYPQGLRMPQATKRNLARFETNAVGWLSWLRFQTTVDTGQTGGMVADWGGRLIGVPTVELNEGREASAVNHARPSDRIPRKWINALRRGAIDNIEIDGVRTLGLGETVHEVAVGDAAEGDETFYYGVPRDRPLDLRVSPDLQLRLVNAQGRTLRRGMGTISLRESDPADSTLAVRITGSRRAETAFSVRAETPQVFADVRPTRNVPEPRTTGGSGPVLITPYFGIPAETSGARTGTTKRAAPPPPAAQATLRGTMVDAISGRPIVGGTVIVARAGFDAAGHLQRYLRGELAEQRFREPLVGYARTNMYGRFEMRAVPRNGRYVIAGFATGYRTADSDVRVGANAATVEVPAIQMTE